MSITPGQAPDLSVYYNSSWGEVEYYSKGPDDKVYNSVGKTPVTADSTQPKENAIGFFARASYLTDGELNVENQSFLVQNWTLFLPQGTITFSPNSSYLEEQVFGNFAFSPSRTLIFRIVSGTRNFFAVNGYVAIVTDPEPGTGRNVYVYFAK
jgi:hypothetical protein